jgi:pyruvate,water dikinase
MVRSDLSSSGVMFSIDTETGFDKFVLITGAWGLGENVVQGAVDPDEFQVFKPFLDNPDLSPIVARDLGAKEIKMIYAGAARRGDDAQRADLQAPSAGFHAQRRRGPGPRPHGQDHRGTLRPADGHGMGQGRRSPASSSSCRPGPKRCSRARAAMSCRITRQEDRAPRSWPVCPWAGGGDRRACLIQSAADIDKFVDGSILVTSITDPDWVPIMKRASAIVTDHGGRTSHAAIVSRELGLPAIVGTGTRPMTCMTGRT